MHVAFTLNLLKILQQHNNGFDCKIFRQRGFCDCHEAYLLRCGISEGKLVLYKDLNDNYNIGGDTVNMAARVMCLAGDGQSFLTADGHDEAIDIGALERYARPLPVLLEYDQLLSAGVVR